MAKISGKAGNYFYPTSNDYWDYYDYLCDAHYDSKMSDFVYEVCVLCEQYAKKLNEYEERYIDDGK